MIGSGGVGGVGAVSEKKICRFVISSSTYQIFIFNGKGETSENSVSFCEESFHASYIM